MARPGTPPDDTPSGRVPGPACDTDLGAKFSAPSLALPRVPRERELPPLLC